jgi:hypothetical protein
MGHAHHGGDISRSFQKLRVHTRGFQGLAKFAELPALCTVKVAKLVDNRNAIRPAAISSTVVIRLAFEQDIVLEQFFFAALQERPWDVIRSGRVDGLRQEGISADDFGPVASSAIARADFGGVRLHDLFQMTAREGASV